MNKTVSGLLIIVLIISCNTVKDKKNICAYTINDFYKKSDNAKCIISKQDTFTEILDTLSANGGDFKFDKNGTLRFYGFLLDANKNSYHFGIDYDEFGNQISEPKCTVVKWAAAMKGSDSLRIIFYLYSIQYSYGELKLYNSNISINSDLYENDFYSTLIRGEVTILKPKEKSKFYVTGLIRNDCTKETKNFIDSTYY